MKKAYSYIRFSTPEQLKGDSLRRQKEASEKYAKELGLPLDTTVNMQDLGLSAYHGTHKSKGALGGFLQLVERGQIAKGSVLIVENLDRLSREEPMKAFSQFSTIVEHGIKLVTLTDRQEYTTELIRKNPYQLMMSLSTMIRANEESELKSQRLKKAWEAKRKNGKVLTGKCPAWLTLSADRSHFEKRKEVVRAIKRIFQLKLEGVGEERIANMLNNSDAWRPPKSKRNEQGGWRKSYVAKILRNRAVIGEFTPHRLVKTEDAKIDKRYEKNQKALKSGTIREQAADAIPDYFPAIVDENTFNRTQSLIQAKSERSGNHGGRTGKATNLFVHLLRCGQCKGPMHFIDKGKLSKGGQYLHCDNNRRGLGCHAKPIRYDEFEQIVFQDLEELDLSNFSAEQKDVSKQIDTLQGNIEDTQQRLKRASKKVSNLLDFIENNEGRNWSEVVQRLAEAKKDKADFEKKVALLEQECAALKEGNKNQKHKLDVVKELNLLLNKAKTEEEKINFRVRLRGELQRLINYIKVYPLTRKYMRHQVLETGEVLFMRSRWIDHVTIRFKGSSKIRILILSGVGERA